ncbi:MAG: thymidine phosphorylase [Chloroflexi bacterium]|nr:thymidine phosphorylase [Chloroflexota bacterium]MCY3937035.1 thymidine phosphorylase [Chloroflexota bacterium]
MLDIIEAKKRGRANSASELGALVSGYLAGDVPDYQMSAWLMAVCLRGMDQTEATALTDIFVASGTELAWESLSAPAVDKHSTGGVGDKTSLVVVPLAAACGLAAPKVSGRGLAFTGGTIDKLESIPGFRVDLTAREFQRQVEEVGAAIVAQSADLVPADRAIYELRDATGTVASPGLIAASIMSKKLAAGAGTIAIDVKVGSGAFMPDYESAIDFADMLVGIGRSAGRKVRAFLTDMNQPLGFAVGHSVEVSEALDVLQGKGPQDVTELALTIVSGLIRDSGLRPAPRAARERAERAISSGTAEAKFREIMRAQSGDLEAFEREPPHERLPVRLPIQLGRGGYVTRVDARAAGRALSLLGGARKVKGESIDHAAGLYITKKVGDPVASDEDWGWIAARDEDSARQALAALREGLSVADSPPPISNLILDQVTG